MSFISFIPVNKFRLGRTNKPGEERFRRGMEKILRSILLITKQKFQEIASDPDKNSLPSPKGKSNGYSLIQIENALS